MVNYFIKLLSIVLILVFTTTVVSAAQIRALVDRNPIPVGESFRLIIEASGSVDDEPDFTELEKVFRVLSTGQSSNFSLINGSITRNKTWTMVLIAEQAGNFTIPAINFGKDKSKTIAIKIIDNASSQNSEKNPEIYLEVSIESKSVYVQQQLIYSIKLFRRIRLGSASLSEPTSENNQAVITKVGNDRDKQVTVDGIAYSVLERRYAIFPQKSGELKIAPVIFETQLNNNRRRSFFNMDPFNSQGTVKRLKSKAVTVQVKSIPAEFTKKYPDAAWLPVADLRISESWSGDVKSFKSGEPMTRTINLRAQNLTAAQLPDIKIDVTKNMKAYPDVPEVSESSNSKGLVASKQFKTALLPTATGNQTLAKITIPWWNVNSNKIQEAILPAVTVTVVPSENQLQDNQTQDSSLKLANKPAIADNNIAMKTNNEAARASDSTQSTTGQSHWWFIFTIIFALMWLITVYLLLSLRAKVRQELLVSDTQRIEIKVSSAEIKKACLENNAKVVSEKLLQWANSQTNSDKFTSLSSLRAYSETELSQAIMLLEQNLYSNKPTEWDGSRFWNIFNAQPPEFFTKKNHKKLSSKLAPLYAKYD